MSLDWSATHELLKERYSAFPKVVQLGYKKRPFQALIKKDPNAGGDQEKIVMRIASLQARSQSFTQAQTNAANMASTYKAFEVVCKENYSLARVTGKMISATRNNDGAQLRALTSEIEGAFDAIMDDDERALFRDGTGLIGTGDGAWTVASTTLTLAHPSQAHCFKVGMEVGATANAASTPRTGTATITAINQAAGTLTTDSNWSAQITSIANTDSLFCAGDYLAANDKKKIFGLEAYCPLTAPTSGDSFHGVDRSINVALLAGTRYDATTNNDPLPEALVNMQSEGGMNGAIPRIAFLSPINMRKLINQLGPQKQYGWLPIQGPNGPVADVGFRTVKVFGDMADIDVLGHPLCPYDVAWMFDPDHLTLLSYGEYPGIIDDDGKQMDRVYNQNQVEVRIGGYPEVATDQPDSIVRGKLA